MEYESGSCAPFMTLLIWLQSPVTMQLVLLKPFMYMATAAAPTAVPALMPWAFLKPSQVGWGWGSLLFDFVLVSCGTQWQQLQQQVWLCAGKKNGRRRQMNSVGKEFNAAAGSMTC